MTQILLLAVAFAAGATAVLAVGRWMGWLLGRHPDLVRGFREGAGRVSWPERVKELAVGIAARELPGSRFAGRRRQIARDLARAALPGAVTPETFLGQAVVEGIGLALLFSLLMLLLLGRPVILLALVIGVGHAFFVRPHGLHARAAERVGRIHRRLPYAIDLAVMVIGAGGTLREALEMLSRRAASDPLAHELAVVLAQVRAGSSQAKALLAMAERVQLEDLTSLVIAINRGEETGAPMARTLETQAEIFRFRRLQRAERLAVEAPVKMMFPNMIIMLGVLLIVLGPVLVKLGAGGGLF